MAYRARCSAPTRNATWPPRPATKCAGHSSAPTTARPAKPRCEQGTQWPEPRKATRPDDATTHAGAAPRAATEALTTATRQEGSRNPRRDGYPEPSQQEQVRQQAKPTREHDARAALHTPVESVLSLPPQGVATQLNTRNPRTHQVRRSEHWSPTSRSRGQASNSGVGLNAVYSTSKVTSGLIVRRAGTADRPRRARAAGVCMGRGMNRFDRPMTDFAAGQVASPPQRICTIVASSCRLPRQRRGSGSASSASLTASISAWGPSA